MWLDTQWGYSVEVDGAKLPPLLTAEQFDAMGGADMSASPEAKAATVAAASQAIRDWCGWHVAPRLWCRFPVQSGRGVMMPVMAVEAGSLTYTGEAVEVGASSFGALYRQPVPMVNVSVRAGIDSGALMQVCFQMAANNLVATAGLREEHVGTAGATYNQTDSGVSGGVRMLDSDRALLAPYRLTGV